MTHKQKIIIMSEIEKDEIRKGQKSLKHWIQYLNITVIIMFLGGFAYVVKKDDLTFDSQEQKQKIIETSNNPPYMPIWQKEKVLQHVDDKETHMSFEEKKALIIIEQEQKSIKENQEKIGQDLQEIKTLLRRKL